MIQFSSFDKFLPFAFAKWIIQRKLTDEKIPPPTESFPLY